MNFPSWAIILMGVYGYSVHLRRKLIQWSKELLYQLTEVYLNLPTKDDILYQVNLPPKPRSFPQFPSLPFEIRALIWEFALPGPRVVEVRRKQVESSVDAHEQNHQYPWLESACPVPALLHTSQESRTMALAHYSLSFGSGKYLPVVYFDFAKDIVYCSANTKICTLFTGRNWRLSKMPSTFEDMEKIKFLAVDSYTYMDMPVLGGLERFEALTQMICVADHDFDLRTEVRLFVGDFKEDPAFNMPVLRLVTSFQNIFRNIKERKPEWRAPAVEKGRFLKGKSAYDERMYSR